MARMFALFWEVDMKKLLSLTALAMALLVATPAMAERRHDYRNQDRGHRYEGRSSRSNWGVSLGFGYSDFGGYRGSSYRDYGYRSYRPVYREPVYRETPVYRSYQPCETYSYRPAYDRGETYSYRPAYDCGETYYPARSYGYTSYSYSSGNYCGTSGSYGSYYSNYSAPRSYYSVRFQYGR